MKQVGDKTEENRHTAAQVECGREIAGREGTRE